MPLLGGEFQRLRSQLVDSIAHLELVLPNSSLSAFDASDFAIRSRSCSNSGPNRSYNAYSSAVRFITKLFAHLRGPSEFTPLLSPDFH